MLGTARLARVLGLGALGLLGCSGVERAGAPGAARSRAEVVTATPLSAMAEAPVAAPHGPGVLADAIRRVAALVPVAQPLGPTSAPARAVVATEPVPEEPAPPVAADLDGRGAVLVATSRETPVYARPAPKAPVIGYLRKGAVVARSDEPAGFDGCKGGYYGVSPEGFVCVGTAASLDPEHRLARVASRRADRTASLPYIYGRARRPGIPVYSRLPSGEELAESEPGFALAASRSLAAAFDGLPFDDVPAFLKMDAAPAASSSRRSTLMTPAVARSGFALVRLFESEGRRYGLTAELSVVPLDALTPVEPSRFHGLPLGPEEKLPVVFTRARSVALYQGDPRTTGLRFERRLDYREGLAVTGVRARKDGTDYLEVSEGRWIADHDLLRVEPRAELPPWAAAGHLWVDVSIRTQTLVAYDGARPVFVTLVSTGKDGEGDPATTRSTIQGEFRIHTKHVTATMDSDEAGDEFDLRDVPYVQYFRDGYAFHAVYWHDGFGTPHSHGCVNLSPLDARWLFAWTEPSVPSGWHGALSPRGTYVTIHP